VARILDDSPANIECLAQALLADRLVGVPTETVYGLAGNALSQSACKQIYEAKGRPFDDPLIVHVHDLEMLDRVAIREDRLSEVADAFWPGPLTVILRRRASVPDVVTSGLDTVAVRIPAHPAFRHLVAAADIPLAAPSANPFGYISPTTSAHVEAQLGDRIDFILEGGPCIVGIESTILDLTHPKVPRILRPGGITADRIEAVIGPVDSSILSAEGNPSEKVIAPGLLDRNYSPTTPLHLRKHVFEPGELDTLPIQVAALCFRRPDCSAGHAGANTYWLTEDGDPVKAAQRLFSILRELDAAGYESIEAEPAPDEGIGRAINDRLRRAAGRDQ
jgi:L-threonylcarbamoyladenylate synthase